MKLGDSSSEDEKDDPYHIKKDRESVKGSKNFFERYSKGNVRDSTPEFRIDKKGTQIQSAAGDKIDQKKGDTKLKNLFKSKGTVRQDSTKRKVDEDFEKRPKRNIFASKKTEQMKKREHVIGDDSSDDDKIPTSDNK
jgi:hypothetical protein